MPESKSLTTLDRRQRILLAAVCGLEFAESLVLTIVIPLLPITAKEKGVTNFEVGILFGVAWLAAALSGVVHGKLLSRITPISLAIAGCVITAIATVGIGLAGQFSRDLVEFLPSVIGLRIMQGCGYSAIAVSAQAILSAEMPEHKLGVQAAYQGSVALGFTLSPPIAGGLYAANGFWLPFIVMSVILLIILIIVAIPLRHLKGQVVQHKSGQYFPLLLQPRAILTVAHSLVIAFVFRFFEGFIPVHMHEQFGWGPAEVAWLFTVCAVVFIIFLPIWVKLNTALMGNVAVMSWCMLMAGISFFLLAPAPFIPVKYPWWASSLVCLFYAISYAGAIVTNVPDLIFVSR
ncbi:MFS-type transporter SLC18B1 isoform X1 [Lingula anatina]|uniref:MFS-type transporter SLC18B1 isoform X1 n=1 Tax=Lingula anatina TaxID=7574 RepID=A0A1S3I3E4_LINAN|nr:MFS-type transporter SLC18B1 isoform X1 [Lingula anatina]|eukprot:XP_013391869.1 MFS-type transporter SLC18B1 isoform X1 [Lingula anatina]